MSDIKDKLDDNVLKLIDRYHTTGKINSKKELYDAMNIPRQRIYQIKKRRARFTFEHLYLLKKYLKIDANELLTINE